MSKALTLITFYAQLNKNTYHFRHLTNIFSE